MQFDARPSKLDAWLGRSAVQTCRLTLASNRSSNRRTRSWARRGTRRHATDVAAPAGRDVMAPATVSCSGQATSRSSQRRLVGATGDDGHVCCSAATSSAPRIRASCHRKTLNGGGPSCRPQLSSETSWRHSPPSSSQAPSPEAANARETAERAVLRRTRGRAPKISARRETSIPTLRATYPTCAERMAVDAERRVSYECRAVELLIERNATASLLREILRRVNGNH